MWQLLRAGLIERSLSYHHSTDPKFIVKWVKEGGVEDNFYSVSYGDEIGLPALDGKSLVDRLREQGGESGLVLETGRRFPRGNLGANRHHFLPASRPVPTEPLHSLTLPDS